MKELEKKIFNIRNQNEFQTVTLQIFRYQSGKNKVYKKYLNFLGIQPDTIKDINRIPFLPIDFFKTNTIICGNGNADRIFLSSGTTSTNQSRHFVTDISIYEKSFTGAFEHFYGKIKGLCILALLPSYLEREGSSLVYMMQSLIRQSGHADSGFYLENFQELKHKLKSLINKKERVLLFGVSFALLDFAGYFRSSAENTIVMETGGMKGRKREITRTELHRELSDQLGVSGIHSEFGMTELLSQAYSKGEGIFQTPPWMRILIRDTTDPFHLLPEGKTGGINIIDLANINSCSFIETRDLGRLIPGKGFEILGRFDNSDIRGCNLLVEQVNLK